MTREADDLDEAGKLTQQLTDAYVQNVQDAARPEQVKGRDGLWPVTLCLDCDDQIPPQRLELGRIRCVFCQGIVEAEKRARR